MKENVVMRRIFAVAVFGSAVGLSIVHLEFTTTGVTSVPLLVVTVFLLAIGNLFLALTARNGD